MQLAEDRGGREIRDYDPKPLTQSGDVWTVEVNPLTGETIAWRLLSDEEVEARDESAANPDHPSVD